MQIKVMQKHIDKGKQNTTNTCAIALALVDEFGLNLQEVKDAHEYDADKDYVSVSEDTIMVRKTNGFSFTFKWTEKIPAAIKRFIDKFDDNKKSVKPFVFKLPFVK